MKTLVSSLLLLLFSSYVAAFPDRAGQCFANATAMSLSAMGGKNDPNLGYSVTVTPGSNGTYMVTVKGKNPFNGLLLYVQDKKNNKIGSWVNVPNNLQILSSCPGNNTLSHIDPSPKQDVQIEWKPSSPGEGKGAEVTGIVVGQTQNSWEIVSADISGGAGQKNGTNSSVPSNSSSNGNTTQNMNGTSGNSTNHDLGSDAYSVSIASPFFLAILLGFVTSFFL